MSQENVEVVRSAPSVQSWRPSCGLAYLDPKVEWYDVPDQPEATVHHGHQGFLRAFGLFLEPFAEFDVHAEELRDLGDQVVVVASAKDPEPNARMLDRILVIAEANGTVKVAVSKLPKM